MVKFAQKQPLKKWEFRSSDLKTTFDNGLAPQKSVCQDTDGQG